MKLFCKEKKPTGAYCCPICKRVYRHAGMAERCTRTAVCRLYNTPPAEVRETWRLVGGAASLGWFLAHPILNTEPEDSGLYGAARAVQDTTGELYAMLHGGFPCADHVRRALHAALTGEVAGIWPPGRPAHLGHVGDVIRSVICDARGEAVARAVRPELLDGTDGYDVFLSGAQAVLTVTSPNVHNGRHLVLFRDSFGSSLAPLLLGSFERITLVDLRYISAARLTDYADLSDATDVLYLCSTAVWNNGGTLRE